MSSKSGASKKRSRTSKGSTAAAAAAPADESLQAAAVDPTAVVADGVALDANNLSVGAEGEDAASAALRSAKSRKLHVGDAASSDEAAAAAAHTAAATTALAADEPAAATNQADSNSAQAAAAPVTPAAAMDGAAATADAASGAADALGVGGAPAAAAVGLSVATTVATPSRSPTPAQASPNSSSATQAGAAAPKSPSLTAPAPTATAGLASAVSPLGLPLPPLPAGMNRGYVAQYYWAHYPPAAPGSATAATIPAALLPQFSEVVASIPAIFQQIITTLQALEQTVHNRDILVELDRKIIKPLTPKEADAVPVLDRKLVLKSSLPAGSPQEYLIHACRRENVKLVFASPEEGGLIGKLGLCPMLIDLFMVQAGGKKQLQGGVGGLRYGQAALAAAAAAAAAGGKRGSSGGAAATANIPEKGADYKCSCGGAAHNGEQLPSVSDATAAAGTAAPLPPLKTEKSPSPRPPTDRTPAASPARKSRAAAAAAQAAEAEPAAVAADEPAGRDAEMHDDPPQITASTAPAAAAPAAAASTARRPPGSGSDGRGSTGGGAFRSPPASGSAHPHASSAFASAGAADGSHGFGPATTATCSNCSTTHKKMAKQAKQLDKMKEELKAVHEERSLWEQKFHDECDHNIRLFEKILLVQQQLRNMSRPLGVSLTHAMNHIATPAMQANQMQQQQQQLAQQQQQQNALAAQAQAQAAAAAAQQAQLVAAQHQGQPVYALTHDGVPVAHGLPHPHALHPHLMAVDPYHAHSTGVMPLTNAQLAEHLHTSEMTSNYPINLQQQLAEQRSRQQMEMRQEAEIRQQQQQQLQQQQVRA